MLRFTTRFNLPLRSPKFVSTALLAATIGFVATPTYATDEAVQEALEGYFDFASFADGVVSPAQLSTLGDLQIIDTRKAEDFEKSHIPGAINIEWRQVIFNTDQIADDKLVVLYCDTGILSSKSHLALKLMGYDNARVLFGGYQEYLKQAK